jgi:betaine-aldehyde dehydrogenase
MTKSLFINGAWQQAHDGGTLEVINPATEEVIDHIASATAVDVDRAVGTARTKGIEEQRQQLSRIEVADNGKPLAEALWDIDDAAGCFAYYADLAEDLDNRQDEPIELPDRRFASALRFEAIGVAAQIIPWNYPLLMAAWKVAPALAAGCTMVLKPSELTSLTALNLAQICQNANLPPGVLNVLTGTGPVAGQALASHPGVDKLAFTGSVPTGTKIMTAAAQDIKNVSLELGGKSPFVVFDDANLEQAVEWIMFGIFWNQGQVCSATSRLIVQEGIANRLLQRLVAESERISIGDGLDPKTLLGPLVSEGQHRKVMAFISEGVRSGARLLTGGGRPEHLQRGYFLNPTIFSDVRDDSAIWTNEIFGPVLCVRTFQTEHDAIRLANATQFGLAAAVMSNDLARCRRVAHAFRAGIVWINCSQPTFSQAPWGGYKKSGIGRELGRWGLDNYLEVKQVTSFDSSDPWGWYLKK